MRATRITAVAAALVLSAALAACGGDGAAGDKSAAPAGTMPSAAPSVTAAGTVANVGAGCAAVPADAANPGSFAAMSRVPVASAAAANPLLSTLVTAVTQAGLVDTLNSAPALTVFAPTNEAFDKIPAADLQAVLADKETLSSILTYHVVQGKLSPAQLAGTHKTIQGDEVTIEGSGPGLTVNEASVVCGNVQTANATVYLIDSVLMPMG